MMHAKKFDVRPNSPNCDDECKQVLFIVYFSSSQFGEFGLKSVEHETHEKYFYGTEHWNCFSSAQSRKSTSRASRAPQTSDRTLRTAMMHANKFYFSLIVWRKVKVVTFSCF